MTSLDALTAANAKRWQDAKVTRLGFTGVAERLVAAKARYLAVSARTGVPWFVIAVIHEREASQNWNSNIAQGDLWNRKSVHVPAGRGPFVSWEDAAVDALVNCSPYAGRNKDWSVGGALTKLEEYNGLGYANRGRPSPYIWSGTDQYVSGKYIADGAYSATTIDVQLGCAGLIKAMMAIDPTIQFGTTVAAPLVVHTTGQPVIPPYPATAPAKPSITNPSPGSIGAWIASFFKKAA